MSEYKQDALIANEIKEFLLKRFTPHFDEMEPQFPAKPIWQRMRDLGTELWLDTGNIEDIEELWTQEFTSVTTNNTLLNKEVQTGVYDDLIRDAAKILGKFELSDRKRRLEFAFILNAHHGLRLVEKFDAHVSVEEHTDLAWDVPAAVEYARRYFELCPERFYVKLPFSPAGLLATRILVREGIPVNHTLGFSARQNYLAARIARPNFVNVFLGRLNSFVADNHLGDGKLVGEKATLASQALINELHQTHDVPSRQIAASIRDGRQLIDLAGVDVITMPPKVARQFLEMNPSPDDLTTRRDSEYDIELKEGVDAGSIRLDTLWSISDRLRKTVDALEKENLDQFSPEQLTSFFSAQACGDVLYKWDEDQMEISQAEGKIPQIDNWRQGLGGRHIGVDSLMNLGGLNSFSADQQAMDDRVQQVLHKQHT